MVHRRAGMDGLIERRRRNLSGQARLVVIEQPAVLDDVLRDRIETFVNSSSAISSPRANAIDQSEIG